MLAVVVLIILTQTCVMLLSFTVPKDSRVSRWLYAPSLIIAWVGYIAYENFYIPRHCTGECDIRIDLLLIYPYLAFVTVCAVAYFARRGSVNGGR